ncbi:hypothetical protein ACQ4PT_016831 [Festuca glaucescens]
MIFTALSFGLGVGEGRRRSLVSDGRVERIASTIRVIPDFPSQVGLPVAASPIRVDFTKPGILFQDITPLLLDPQAFRDTTDLFVERYKDKGITVVAGEVISEEYFLEYGTDKIEMHAGAVQPNDLALIVDDLIATGGTLCAAAKLIGELYGWTLPSIRGCSPPLVGESDGLLVAA